MLAVTLSRMFGVGSSWIFLKIIIKEQPVSLSQYLIPPSPLLCCTLYGILCSPLLRVRVGTPGVRVGILGVRVGEPGIRVGVGVWYEGLELGYEGLELRYEGLGLGLGLESERQELELEYQELELGYLGLELVLGFRVWYEVLELG